MALKNTWRVRGGLSQLSVDSWFQIRSWSQFHGFNPHAGLCTLTSRSLLGTLSPLSPKCTLSPLKINLKKKKRIHQQIILAQLLTEWKEEALKRHKVFKCEMPAQRLSVRKEKDGKVIGKGCEEVFMVLVVFSFFDLRDGYIRCLLDCNSKYYTFF